MDRRKFIKITGITLAGVTLGMGDSLFGKVYASPQNVKRWAMVIDIGVCLKNPECRDCVDACVLTHNIPDFNNRKDEVKWIWKARYGDVFHDSALELTKERLPSIPIPVLCNHCENPPCVKVCPTKATWKREDGIVMMDYHRCIGCRYCMAACPYGARSFNWREPRPYIKKINPDYPTRTKGVVEKCSLCEERIALNKLPACVEACKHKGMALVDTSAGRLDSYPSIKDRHIIARKTHLGTKPRVYYVL
ncbi:MAG: 4Fe-4S dicluster domain-containing protein [Syntrophorhabdaceae bacterium]|nr:4Fe-4S dicluster domain-containing protein [Syntrophorhabdaceae bacterium]